MQAIQERPADLIFLTRRTYARLILLRRLTLMALFFIPKYFNRGIVLCLASIVIAPFLLAAMYTVFSPSASADKRLSRNCINRGPRLYGGASIYALASTNHRLPS